MIWGVAMVLASVLTVTIAYQVDILLALAFWTIAMLILLTLRPQ